MYADAIFIVEPLFWAAAVPALVFAARTLAVRVGLVLFLAASLGLAWTRPILPTYSAALLTLLTVGMMVATWRARPLARSVLAVTACSIVGIGFFAASLRARMLLARAASAPDAVVRAIALTPMPANPFCFDAWVVETRGPTYAARRAMVAPWPGLVPAERCRIDTMEHPTAPLSHDPSPATTEIRWRSVFRAPRAELSELALSSCVAAAFLRFSRVPYWTKAERGYVVGDLRYDRNPGLDFADIPLAPPGSSDEKCPAAVPPWTPPRLDVLDLP
jgi:inner membrane protein